MLSNKENLILLRSFLFKMFIVGILFAIFFFLATTIFWNVWSPYVYSKFQLSEKEQGELIFNWFLHLRFFLIFLVLVPAISLHWMIKTDK